MVRDPVRPVIGVVLRWPVPGTTSVQAGAALTACGLLSSSPAADLDRAMAENDRWRDGVVRVHPTASRQIDYTPLPPSLVV